MNPRVKDFLEKHEKVTIMGLFWAGYWRFMVAIYGGVFAFAVITAGLVSIFE